LEYREVSLCETPFAKCAVEACFLEEGDSCLGLGLKEGIELSDFGVGDGIVEVA
jgi:hypothetical protein